MEGIGTINCWHGNNVANKGKKSFLRICVG